MPAIYQLLPRTRHRPLLGRISPEVSKHDSPVCLEPAGAHEIDALRSLPPEQLAGRTVVCITSGGNFDKPSVSEACADNGDVLP